MSPLINEQKECLPFPLREPMNSNVSVRKERMFRPSTHLVGGSFYGRQILNTTENQTMVVHGRPKRIFSS